MTDTERKREYNRKRYLDNHPGCRPRGRRELLFEGRRYWDLTGQKFNNLSAIEPAFHVCPSGKRELKWRFRCDCGNEKLIIGWLVKNGRIKSCGCLQAIGQEQRKQRNRIIYDKCRAGMTYRAVANEYGLTWQRVEQIYRQRRHALGDFERKPGSGWKAGRYDWNAFEADQQEVSELIGKMDKCFHGYSRMVIALACSRSIAVMFGPAKSETREDYLRRLPDYMRSMWKLMAEITNETSRAARG